MNFTYCVLLFLSKMSTNLAGVIQLFNLHGFIPR